MATEWVDVIDTTIKIGLGALISGVSTYLVSSINHKNNIEKSILDHKMNMVIDISEHVERYFYFGTSMSNALGRAHYTTADKRRPLTQLEQVRISDSHQDFNSVLESRNKALSRIRILSIDAAEKALIEYNDTLAAFRKITIFENLMPTATELEQFSSERKEHSSNFYKAIGNYMNSMKG